MVTHTQNLCSAFNPSKVHTHSSEHTHTVNTRRSGQPFYAAVPGEQLGVRCLAQEHLSRGIEMERALYIHSPHLQFLPARDSNSQPFDYESDSLTIRPRLPRSSSCTTNKQDWPHSNNQFLLNNFLHGKNVLCISIIHWFSTKPLSGGQDDWNLN